MGLVVIISDIYYSLANYQNLMIKPLLLMIAASSYILLTLLGFFTFGKDILLKQINYIVSGNFKAFGYYSEFLIGVGYLCIGLAFIYFGEKMGEFIKLTRTTDTPDDSKRNEQLSFKVIL